MNSRALVVFFWACLIASATIAGEKHDTTGVTINSADEIDDETRAKLEQVLKDAGKDGEILILDGSEPGDEALAHDEHDVHVTRKKVETTN